MPTFAFLAARPFFRLGFEGLLFSSRRPVLFPTAGQLKGRENFGGQPKPAPLGITFFPYRH